MRWKLSAQPCYNYFYRIFGGRGSENFGSAVTRRQFSQQRTHARSLKTFCCRCQNAHPRPTTTTSVRAQSFGFYPLCLLFGRFDRQSELILKLCLRSCASVVLFPGWFPSVGQLPGLFTCGAHTLSKYGTPALRLCRRRGRLCSVDRDHMAAQMRTYFPPYPA